MKLFVNCCNSCKKRNKDRDPKTPKEPISIHEVSHTGKRDIEGYALLLSEFIPQMIQSSRYPAIVNVDNKKEKSKGDYRDDLEEGQVFYQSTLKFKDTLTTLLGKQEKKIKTLNVKIDFEKLESGIIKKKHLANQTFAYLGIKQSISIC